MRQGDAALLRRVTGAVKFALNRARRNPLKQRTLEDDPQLPPQYFHKKLETGVNTRQPPGSLPHLPDFPTAVRLFSDDKDERNV
jgi:hypothetical protein